MGVKGFFGYLNRERVDGAIIEYSINDILEQIRLYQEQNDKPAKILINLRAFNNYYEETGRDIIFGCRFNVIRKDFDSLLSSLKLAGAELIFVSKKNYVDQKDDVQFEKFDDDYKQGLNFVKFIASGTSFELNRKLARLNKSRLYPWQETTVDVLVQTAKNYGTFMESDCFLNTTASHMQLAKNEDVFAVCGLNTSYLFYEGSWKIFFPAKNTRTRSMEMIFKEFNKEKILQHFQLNSNQFHLFSVLGGKIITSLEHTKTLYDHFKSDRATNFPAIATFVRNIAPANKFPLQRDTIDAILTEIFGYFDDQLREDFQNALSNNAKLEAVENFCNIDKKTKDLLQNDSFSSYAECILYNIPIVILSPFLDATATDMKTLKLLTSDWIQRFAGILLKDIDESRTFSVVYRLPSEKLEKFESNSILPIGLLSWNRMIAETTTMDEKFDTLAFLTDNLISVVNLKTIPLEYMMHVIITMQLIKNESMTIKEAVAMTKAVRSINESGYTVYPKNVNVRAFRVSALYEKMYSVLLMCLSPLGLMEFMADLKLDNVSFQNNLNDRSEAPITGEAFKCILDLLT